MQHIIKYALEARTEKGKVLYSLHAYSEQLRMLDEYIEKCTESDGSWRSYEDLLKGLLLKGNTCLEAGDYQMAYCTFSEGVKVCIEAWEKFPEDPLEGYHPFRSAFDDMARGCNIAALRDNCTLKEVYYESNIRELRQQFADAEAEREEELKEFQCEAEAWKFGSDDSQKAG